MVADKDSLDLVSYTFATLAGICFMGGLFILSGGRRG